MKRSRTVRALGVPLLAAIMGAAALSAPLDAFAQAPGSVAKVKVKLDPPTPQVPSKPASFLVGIGVALLLAMATVGATMIPSKRGHQD